MGLSSRQAHFFYPHFMNLFYKHFPTDLLTPLAFYAKLRDFYPQSVLFECYNGARKTVYMACDPIQQIEAVANELKIRDPYGNVTQSALTDPKEIPALVDAFLSNFKKQIPELEFEYPMSFGYFSHESVQYFDAPKLEKVNTELPWMFYAVYRYVFVLPMDAAEGICVEHSTQKESSIDVLFEKIQNHQLNTYPFQKIGTAKHQPADEDFLTAVAKAQYHIQRGDVFQLVLSKSITQAYQGDDFEVYRELRRRSPMPYQFYYDFGTFRLMGASPEAQVEIQNQKVTLHPIAGTFPKSGCKETDSKRAEALANDPKEQAEHAMLVDLARHDLSKNCKMVQVSSYREVKTFSHVIHLVSEVNGQKNEEISALQILGDTFPAGTLSGAPKYRALELIDELEHQPRHFYGGSIGFFGSKSQMTKAIMIRTLCSQKQELHLRAGAGIVAASKAENELKEVYHKLAALNHAIDEAHQKHAKSEQLVHIND